MNLHSNLWRDVLYGFVDGEVEYAESVRMFKLAVDLAADRRVSRVLIDGRLLRGALSNTERLELAKEATEHLVEVMTNPSIAVVGHPPTFNGLAVLEAQLQGGLNVRLCHSIPEALEWLGHPVPAH